MSKLKDLKVRFEQIRRTIDGQVAEAKMLASRGKQLNEEIQLAENDVDLYNKVAITLASIGEQRQEDAQQQIEELVTRGLTTIFNENIQFKLTQTQRGKTPEVKFSVISDGLNNHPIETSVMDARGGGMSAIVGFLLRLVILLLSKDKEPILIMDESFSHVSAEFRRPLIEFIVELVNKTRVQIFVVTHDEIFLEYADKRYRLEQTKGITTAKEF